MDGKGYLSKSFNPSIETLVAKYLEYRERLERHDRKEPGSDDEVECILFCRAKLDEVESALFPADGARKKVFAAWQLLHRVGEEMILLMDQNELSAYGLRLEVEIKTSTLPDVQKTDWTKKISETVKKCAASGCNDEELKHARHMFKNMHRAVNSIVDDSFWDLWAKKLLALSYTVLLILAILWLLIEMSRNACLTPLKILTLGAAGGLLSGILTGERETIPKGHFWAPITYYILARPALGALAALVTFWMIESQFLITIDPPLTEDVKAFTCASSAKGKFVTPQVSEPPHPQESPQRSGPQVEKSGKKEKGSIDVSMVTLTAKKGKQNYLYLLVLLFAGFAGDKLLKIVADRVTAKLIAQAEKTKELK